MSLLQRKLEAKRPEIVAGAKANIMESLLEDGMFQECDITIDLISALDCLLEDDDETKLAALQQCLKVVVRSASETHTAAAAAVALAELMKKQIEYVADLNAEYLADQRIQSYIEDEAA